MARIALGWTFLWAFVDKTFGLGFATEGKVFHDFFAGLASPLSDWLFTTGLVGVGAASRWGSACGSPRCPAPCC